MLALHKKQFGVRIAPLLVLVSLPGPNPVASSCLSVYRRLLQRIPRIQTELVAGELLPSS